MAMRNVNAEWQRGISTRNCKASWLALDRTLSTADMYHGSLSAILLRDNIVRATMSGEPPPTFGHIRSFLVDFFALDGDPADWTMTDADGAPIRSSDEVRSLPTLITLVKNGVTNEFFVNWSYIMPWHLRHVDAIHRSSRAAAEREKKAAKSAGKGAAAAATRAGK